MYIYTSEYVHPYVYMCVHKTSKQFYIGSRTANKLQSHLDLPNYRTSSKYVNPKFDQFDWFIIAEFFNGIDAYDYEQQLIFENWSNPLLINKAHHYGATRFSTAGTTHSAITRAKISLGRKGKVRKPFSAIARANMSAARTGKSKKPHSAEAKAKISSALSGISQQQVTCPHCNKEGGISVMNRWHFDNCKLK